MIAEIGSVMALVVKGVGIAQQMLSIGKDAGGVLTAIKDLGVAAVAGPVTVEQLEDTETILDLEMAEFNEPL